MILAENTIFDNNGGLVFQGNRSRVFASANSVSLNRKSGGDVSCAVDHTVGTAGNNNTLPGVAANCVNPVPGW